MGNNLFQLYIIRISKWFNMVMPVVVLFYQDNGLSMHDIFVLKAIYSVAIVVMEIPSGWMADVWGRKKTVLAGSFLGSAGFLMYSFSYGFEAFILAEIILGIGHSFVSGADSALLFDSLKSKGKAAEYIKQEGRITSAGNFAEALAGVAGGFLAAISLRTPFYFQFAVAAMAIPASLLLYEPATVRPGNYLTPRQMLITIRDQLVNHKELRISILLSSLTGTATLTFAWLVQPFFKEIELPVELFGIMWTALNLTVAVSSAFAHYAGIFPFKKFSLPAIILLLSAGYFLSGWQITRWGMVFLFMFYAVRGIATPVLKNHMNQHTGSEVRATILSVRNFIIRILFAVTGPLLGWITDNAGLELAFYLAGAIYLVPAVVVVLPWLTGKSPAPD